MAINGFLMLMNGHTYTFTEVKKMTQYKTKKAVEVPIHSQVKDRYFNLIIDFFMNQILPSNFKRKSIQFASDEGKPLLHLTKSV